MLTLLHFYRGMLDRKAVRRVATVFIQPLIFAFSLVLAFLVRFDGDVPTPYAEALLSTIVPLVALRLVVFWRMGLLAGWWAFVSLPDMVKIARAVLAGSVLFALFVAVSHHGFPRSILLMEGVFCFLGIGGVRVLSRWVREFHADQLKGGKRCHHRVLLIGAGAIGQMIAREIRCNPKLETTVIGYLDNDPQRVRQRFQGLPVLGTIDDLECVVRTWNVREVIISQSAVLPRELRQIVEFCRTRNLGSKILPGMGDILSGKVSIQHIRDVQIEDLLGRKPVQLSIHEIQRYLSGKRILVTGAGGSIGSEICRQVAGFGPAQIALIENAETPLFQIETELRERFPDLEVYPLLCDVRDPARVEAAFERFLPEVVFHAAAYKHVPLSELNPEEVIRNNVLGSRHIADAAHAFGAQHFVMISTDKAVNPTNIMGATKRVAEIYVQDLALRSQTKFVTVRFGNVLGSNGSVVPIFREQIRRGGPVKVTHPEVTRFFMTIPEAVQLVLQAGSMGKGGEIFLLDMGEPVRIVHLAEEMIRLSGLRPHEDVEIVFTGLRPGEKLYEELLLAGEGVAPTTHEKIRVFKAARYNPRVLQRQVLALQKALSEADRAAARAIIREMVPEYVPSNEPPACVQPFPSSSTPLVADMLACRPVS